LKNFNLQIIRYPYVPAPWGADDIPGILNTLEKEDIKATFFMVGQWAEKYPDAVKMISIKGHDIGNHSYSHLRMGSIDRGKIRKEISLCTSRLEEISGSKVELFRAPFGDYNNSVVGTARELGIYTIQWDVEGMNIKVKKGKFPVLFILKSMSFICAPLLETNSVMGH